MTTKEHMEKFVKEATATRLQHLFSEEHIQI